MRCTRVTNEFILAESFFCPYACHFCKTPGFNLKTCSRCKLVSYCSVNHQKKHWTIHRKLCTHVGKIIKSSDSKNIFDICDLNSNWSSKRSKAMSVVETRMGKALNPAERQMFWFPAACPICHCFKIEKYLICTRCYSVSYCSKYHKIEHGNSHKNNCEKLKLSFELSRNMAMHDHNLELAVKRSVAKETLPRHIKEFIDKFIVFNDINYFSIISSDILSCVTTMMYSIERGKLLPKQSSQINITVVGSEITLGPEGYIIKYLEIFTHWADDINKIRISFVGPTDNQKQIKPTLCYSCSNKNISLNFYPKLYHDFVSSLDYVQPDIIMIFNCGFHENQNSNSDTWNDTIPFLYDSKSLIVLTSYSQNEALKDYKRLIELKPSHKQVEVVDKCVENPFRSLRPHWDWENDDIYYQNNYMTIIKTNNSSLS